MSLVDAMVIECVPVVSVVGVYVHCPVASAVVVVAVPSIVMVTVEFAGAWPLS